MMEELGTRAKQGFSQIHLETQAQNGRLSRDVGMSKRVVTTATFTASNKRITGSGGDFAAFIVGDPVEIFGTNLNNGLHQVTALDGGSQAFLVLDVGVKDEGPVAGVEVRTP